MRKPAPRALSLSAADVALSSRERNPRMPAPNPIFIRLPGRANSTPTGSSLADGPSPMEYPYSTGLVLVSSKMVTSESLVR